MRDFSEGLAAVGVGGQRDAQGNVTTMSGARWGFIDQKGNIVIRPQFDEVNPFSSGVAVVWSESVKKLGLIDRTGNLILPYKFTSIEPFQDGLALARGPQGPAFITPHGRITVEAAAGDSGTRFEDFGAFSEGLAPAYQGDSKVGFIDKSGRIKIAPRFNGTLGFAEGLAAVEIEDRWGYINTSGAMVIKPRFLNAHSFVDGLALVDVGTFWSYIDAHGSVVLDDVFRLK